MLNRVIGLGVGAPATPAIRPGPPPSPPSTRASRSRRTGERAADRPSAASYRNILRLGFREAYVRPNLVSPPDDEVA